MSQQVDSWSTECVNCIGPEIGQHNDGTLHHLDTYHSASFAEAVEDLNSGAISCAASMCIVFLADSQAYHLLVRNGHEAASIQLAQEIRAGLSNTEQTDEKVWKSFDFPRRQYLFFVRHAESRWNRAQRDGSLFGMWGENDHGLTEQGRCEAQSFRKRVAAAVETGDPWARRFNNPDAIFVSPLTRALETVAIGLEDVLASSQAEVVVTKGIREKKNVGGLDNTGVAVGFEIRARLEKELEDLYSASDGGAAGEEQESFELSSTAQDAEKIERAAQLKSLLTALRTAKFNFDDVQDPWWNGIVETEANYLDRVNSFIDGLRHCECSNIVIVGHSAFMRKTFCVLAGRGVWGRSFLKLGGLVDRMQSVFLPHCGTVGIRITWPDEDGEPFVDRTVPLFGLQVADLDDQAVNSPGRPRERRSGDGWFACCSGRDQYEFQPLGLPPRPNGLAKEEEELWKGILESVDNPSEETAKAASLS